MKKIFLLSFVLLTLLHASAQEGVLDASFATGGFVRLGVKYDGTAFTPDGKLVGVQGFTNSFTLRRYKTDGTIDETFGNGGSITIVVPYLTGTAASGGIVPYNVLVAVQSNGNIVVDIEGGTSYSPDGST